MNIIEKYFEQNEKSRQQFEEAKKFLPSGNTRSALYWPPFPVYLDKGRSNTVYDIDGNKRIDFNYNNTTLIHGHNHPDVMRAAQAQIKNGTVLGTPTEAEVKLAEELTSRLQGADRIRFTPSGTEANMQAIRLARAYTGKPIIAKCMGAYHGSWDAVPLTPDTVGIPDGVEKNTIYFPYNNSVEAEKKIKKHSENLAAVIVEPTMRDMTPEPGFLETIREVTENTDILLIFDEVISFRLSHGGAQEYYGVTPDITTLGKIIGGGFPVGAYASTEEIFKPMMIPQKELPEVSFPELGFSGTFNAHPVSMAAGLAVLRMLRPSVYDELERMGHQIRTGLKKALEEEEVLAHIGGAGSLFHINWTDKEVKNHNSSKTGDRALHHYFNLGMMNRGVFILGHPNISTAQTPSDINYLVNSAQETIEEMKPLIEKKTPHLLRT
jgi:glutamate-1-semialdehyde 2,1-aminomutase